MIQLRIVDKLSDGSATAIEPGRELLQIDGQCIEITHESNSPLDDYIAALFHRFRDVCNVRDGSIRILNRLTNIHPNSFELRSNPFQARTKGLKSFQCFLSLHQRVLRALENFRKQIQSARHSFWNSGFFDLRQNTVCG